VNAWLNENGTKINKSTSKQSSIRKRSMMPNTTAITLLAFGTTTLRRVEEVLGGCYAGFLAGLSHCGGSFIGLDERHPSPY
jgi:hypothetical protein